MFMFTVLIHVGEFRQRRDFRFTSLQRAESVRRVWLSAQEKFPVSPIVRMTGGTK